MNAEPICATRDWETRKHAENPMLDRRLKKKKRPVRKHAIRKHKDRLAPGKQKKKKVKTILETEQATPLLAERINDDGAQEETNGNSDRNLDDRVTDVERDRIQASACSDGCSVND